MPNEDKSACITDTSKFHMHTASNYHSHRNSDGSMMWHDHHGDYHDKNGGHMDGSTTHGYVGMNDGGWWMDSNGMW